ncbi:hypothetical protein BDZ97DRAFT_1661204, partial [Flammula alnicola]
VGEVFYAQYTKTFHPENETAWGPTSPNNLPSRLKTPSRIPQAPNNTGLLYHGYDFSPTALVDVLDVIPQYTPG